MNEKKSVLHRTSRSGMTRVDAHVIKPSEYKELPELTDEMLERAAVKKGGRPRTASPRQAISLRLPPEVIARCKATGPGWQTRMAERVAKTPVPRSMWMRGQTKFHVPAIDRPHARIGIEPHVVPRVHLRTR